MIRLESGGMKKKRLPLIMKFHGGPLDGQTIESDACGPQHEFAICRDAWWFIRAIYRWDSAEKDAQTGADIFHGVLSKYVDGSGYRLRRTDPRIAKASRKRKAKES